MVTRNSIRRVRYLNIPNLITIFRLFLIPFFLKVFHSNMENRILYSGIIFFMAGVSDVLDGYIARKFNLTTKIGAMLDPLADKLMSFAVLISFTMADLIPIWILIPIIIKELFMIFGAAFLYLRFENEVIPARIYGKLGTVFLYISIFSIVLKAPEFFSKILLSITMIINIVALYNYVKLSLEAIRNKPRVIDK